MSDTDGKRILLADEYDYQIFIPWGEPLLSDAPEWSWPPTAAAQARQIGVGHDGMNYFPLSEDGRHGLLAINHEYGINPHVIGAANPTTANNVLASQHAHGVSVIEIKEINGIWQQVRDSKYSRRVHTNTPMRMAGPAAEHPLLNNPINNPVLGTLNNCASGETPWGSYLTCEENFNLYFSSEQGFEANESQQRYGLNNKRSYYGWHKFDPRFDLANPDYANESNRFGWVVEIDPTDPSSTPIKRTALGRFKHEGATVVEDEDGRIVVYMGDDERFEFIYKFVSSSNWRVMRSAGISPLDEGILYVARFDGGIDNSFDSQKGKGEWLPLSLNNPMLSNVFKDQGEILVNARLAATLVGATPMDRPEWISIGPNSEVYCTLTNNTKHTEADAANPLAPNPYGQIIRWREKEDIDGNRYTGKRFTWDHFLLCDEIYATEDSLGSPDGLWADPDGRLFICTDGPQHSDKPNQLMVADTRTGELSRLLVGINGCEITGLTTTPDRCTLFVNVQHPGNGDPAVTSFPSADDGKTVPRDCTLVIKRKDGSTVGS